MNAFDRYCNVISVAHSDQVILSMSITLDDQPMTLTVLANQTPDEAVVAFCQTYLPDEMAGCVRQLLPDVIERLKN